MAAFGITFPKLRLCRSTTSKVDSNTVSTTTSPPPATTTTASTRTLSLSIKNVPSQPLHYDVSTTTVKKKPISMANILAIDGETKQLPKNLSVFNELQLDDDDEDINEKRKRAENSSNVIVSSSLSPMGNINHRSDLRFVTTNVDSKKVLNEDKMSILDCRSNHTFTPPTSSLSYNSSSNDLHLTSSTRSIDLPQLKYAIEKFLVDDDHPIYQIADEFSSGYIQDHHGNAPSSNVTKSDLQDQQYDNTNLHSTHDKNTNDEVSSRSVRISNGSMKWYVSELRIHRPLIYRTQLTNEQQQKYSSNRKFSHSFNDLENIYNFSKCSEKNRTRKNNDIAYSTLSLQNCLNQQEYRHQSDDNILLNNHLSFTDDDLNHLHIDEDDRHLSSLTKQRTLDQSMGKADRLIRNESVKKKLIDILNDDELENACLEDMSQEFEETSLNHHRDLQALNSFSSSSDDALYSSPPNEPYLPPPPPPPPPLLSSSYNEIPSANINKTNEYYFGRSRLITTSLDKIPMNHTSSSTCLLRPSYEQMHSTWYTSPSPQWRMDDQLPMISILKRHSLRNDDHRNGIDSNRLLSTNIAEYDVKENKNIQKYNHHYRKEQKRVNYSLMNTPTALVKNNSTTVLPIIQDKSSNLLMFI